MKKRLLIIFFLISFLYIMNEILPYKEYYKNNFVTLTTRKISLNSNSNIITIEKALKILQNNNNKCTYKLFTDTQKISPFISENFYVFHVIENDLEYDSLYCVHKTNGSIYQYWPNGKYKKLK